MFGNIFRKILKKVHKSDGKCTMIYAIIILAIKIKIAKEPERHTCIAGHSPSANKFKYM